MNKFEVCKLVAALLDQGAIEPVPVEELRSLADDAAREGDDAGVVKFLQRVLDEGELTADLHLGLARAFENLGELEKAACHHKLFAESRLEDGETDDALQTYAHICQVLPTDLFGRGAVGLDALYVLGEHAGDVAAGAREGMPAAAVHVATEHAAIAEALAEAAHPGDVILVKGSRGIHMEEVVRLLEEAL